MNPPLAERIRPKTLETYTGQPHLVGLQGALIHHINTATFPSLIFWGPPGTGKTTLAQIIAHHSQRPFHSLSAISSGVKDIRVIIEKAKQNEGLFTPKNPILFIDEIHRFSKSQQDALLGAVEKGYITLIGATTENPSFEVIPALLSRCQVFPLYPLEKEDLEMLLHTAIKTDTILASKNITLKETAALLRFSGGDARKLLNTFELIINAAMSNTIVVTDKLVCKAVQQNTALYDKNGEYHYDIISAFIKSIRGSDPNAAVYWLARMIEGGEDVKFIARRMLILASEDIGNANPNALVIANTTFQAATTIGYPEARIILSQCAIYLAASPKSNASYTAINKAQQLVRQTGDLSVPLALRNAPTTLMKDFGYGKAYVYPHDCENHFVDFEYLPEALSGTSLYQPAQNSREQIMAQFLKNHWKDKYEF